MKSRFSFVLLLVLLLSMVQVSAFASDDPARLSPVREYTDRWVIQLAPGVDATAFAAQYGYQLLGNIGGMPGWYEIQIANTAKNTILASTAAQTLALTPQVVLFEQEYLVYTEVFDAPPTDPIYASQWHLDNTGQFGGTSGADANVVPVWADNITGSGIHIGIIDDGLQHTHPDLDSTKFIASRSYDYADNNSDVAPVTSGSSCSTGDNCHGTSVAGVAAAQANNAVCGAGAAYNATISGQRLITGVGLTDTQIANALLNSQASNTTPVDVSNNSWGYTVGGDPGTAIRNALQTGAVNNNTIYMFAAGNGHPSNAGRSGLVNSRYTIAVGASTNQGLKSSYSEEGSAVFISSPSNGGTAGIYTTDLLGSTNGYGGIGAQPDCTSQFGGTSSATPLASGVVALMLQANPNLTWRDVQHILANSSTPFNLGDSSWQTNGAGHLTSNRFGFGRIDAEAAVDMAASWITVGPYLNQNGSTVTVNRTVADGSGNLNNPIYGTARTSTFTVNNSTIDNLEHVEVSLRVSHTYGGTDLRVRLTSPSGTVSELYDLAASGAPSFNNGRILMSVQFWDEDPNGTWTISVQDGWVGGTGTFVNWQLRLYGTSGPLPNNVEETNPVTGIELVQNGGFESQSRDMISTWTVKNASGDQTKCNLDKDLDGVPDKIYANSGSCAFVFKGGVDEASKVRQNLNLNGVIPAAGDTLNLSYYAKSQGGATVKTSVVVTYADAVTTKIVSKSDGSAGYTLFSGSGTLASANVTGVKITVGTKSTIGKVSVDDVSLQYASAGGLIPLPGTSNGLGSRQ